jgi:hypothetical protein
VDPQEDDAGVRRAGAGSGHRSWAATAAMVGESP